MPEDIFPNPDFESHPGAPVSNRPRVGLRSRDRDAGAKPAGAVRAGRIARDLPPEGPVLFAYDGFEHAKAAIRQAGRHFCSGRAAIVLTVWRPFRAMPFASTPVAPQRLEINIELEARRVADEGARLAR